MKLWKIATRSPIQDGVGLGSPQSSRLSRIIFSLSTLQSQLCTRQAGIYWSTSNSQIFSLRLLYSLYGLLSAIYQRSFYEEGVSFHLCLRHRFFAVLENFVSRVWRPTKDPNLVRKSPHFHCRDMSEWRGTLKIRGSLLQKIGFYFVTKTHA